MFYDNISYEKIANAFISYFQRKQTVVQRYYFHEKKKTKNF